MSASQRAVPLHDTNSTEARLLALETQLGELRAELEKKPETVPQGQVEQLSLIVFSGSLDKLIAALVLATGAAASGMDVHLFFTFWGTSALRDASRKTKKTFLERLVSWFLPKNVSSMPLSQMNMGGGGPVAIRHMMKKKGVASVDEMLEMCAELDVKFHVCTMSMDLLGMKETEMLDYPNLSFCGVTKFLETAAPGKLTMFV